MGYEAVRVLAEGMTNRVICVRDDQIVNVDIDEGLAMKKTLNAEEFEVMTVMTVCEPIQRNRIREYPMGGEAQLLLHGLFVQKSVHETSRSYGS